MLETFLERRFRSEITGPATAPTFVNQDTEQRRVGRQLEQTGSKLFRWTIVIEAFHTLLCQSQKRRNHLRRGDVEQAEKRRLALSQQTQQRLAARDDGL